MFQTRNVTTVSSTLDRSWRTSHHKLGSVPAPLMAGQDSGRKPGAGFSRIETLPETATPSRFKTDDIVGSRYRLISFIGEGAMGEVFVAENVAIGVRVAIKFLKPELLT